MELDKGILLGAEDQDVISINGLQYVHKSRFDIALSALRYIANSNPGPHQSFEIENKLAAQKAIGEIGEEK